MARRLIALCVLAVGCASSTSTDASGGVDAGVEFSCNDDALVTGDPGGNDTLATATQTGVGTGAVVYSGARMAICPASDVDLFALDPRPIDSIEARVFFDPDVGAIALRIIDAGGNQLAAGSDTDQRGAIRLRYSHDSPETLFVEVSSGDGAENNYDVQVYVTD